VVRERALRPWVAAYLAILCIAALPESELPAVGGAERAASAVLETVGIVPGMDLFRGAPRDWKVRALCLSVTGRAPDGTLHGLYGPECPPRGTLFFHDAFDETMQWALRNVSAKRLLRSPDAIPEGSRPPEDVRRVLVLGDYFCHSPLLAPEPRNEVILRQRSILRSYRTGRWAERELACHFACDPDEIVVPSCRRGELMELSSSRARSGGAGAGG
jgi:hypothetical protein